MFHWTELWLRKSWFVSKYLDNSLAHTMFIEKLYALLSVHYYDFITICLWHWCCIFAYAIIWQIDWSKSQWFPIDCTRARVYIYQIDRNTCLRMHNKATCISLNKAVQRAHSPFLLRFDFSFLVARSYSIITIDSLCFPFFFSAANDPTYALRTRLIIFEHHFFIVLSRILIGFAHLKQWTVNSNTAMVRSICHTCQTIFSELLFSLFFLNIFAIARSSSASSVYLMACYWIFISSFRDFLFAFDTIA